MAKTKLKAKTKMVNYPVGDFLIRVKNAALAGRFEIVTPMTKMIVATAEVLKSEGFVSSIEQKEGELVITLRKHAKEPVLLGLTLISRPGLRQYMNFNEIMSKKGPEVYIISTPVGVISSRAAKKKVVGGEVIAKVW